MPKNELRLKFRNNQYTPKEKRLQERKKYNNREKF